MSIATKRGDSGQTSLASGMRVSKADERVEAYGSVDELNTVLGFARSICRNAEVRSWTEEIQRTLFRLGSALAIPPEARTSSSNIVPADVDRLTDLVHKIEAMEGLVSDWSLPGGHPEAAAYEMARTACRRTERTIVRFNEAGGHVDANVLAYLNRLSDLIWLFGRLLELEAGVDSRLRKDEGGARWSRAW